MAAGHKKYAAIFPNIRGLTAGQPPPQPHPYPYRACGLRSTKCREVQKQVE